MIEWIVEKPEYLQIKDHWKLFLDQNKNESENYKYEKIKIIFNDYIPTIIDSEGRKFKIDFQNDHLNYNKFKTNITSESISKALGGGKKGIKVLDLSAGMGIDAVFLYQLGYEVTALERNPLIYLALAKAYEYLILKKNVDVDSNLKFIFSDAKKFLSDSNFDFDVCYFDPMFPQKKKSALSKQEMMLFKNLVGDDKDAADVLRIAISSKKFKRCVVKRPVAAEPLLPPAGALRGKIIRYDIYGG